MRGTTSLLIGPLIARYFFAPLGGCRHTKMGWPIRLDGCTYRVCLGCGIKRLFDEESFLSYGRYSYDVKQLAPCKRPSGTIYAFRPDQEMGVSQ